MRILHTADLQLGMPFSWAGGDAGARLRRVREESIDSLARLAAEHGVDCVLIAGDLFDANTVDDAIVAQAGARFARIGVPTYVIPGNHDHCGSPDSVYRRAAWRRACPATLHVITDPDPILTPDGAALILPAPLRHRHQTGDSTAHLSRELGRDRLADGFRIGLAHGSTVAFDGSSRGESPNRIAPDRADLAGLDYLALGDWHSTREVGPRTWYSGAPEPTGFAEPDSGNVLLVDIPAPGATPTITPIPVARTRWLRHAADLHDPADLERLETWLAALEAPIDSLLRLELRGSLPFASLKRLDELLAHWRHTLLVLRLRGPGVLPAPGDAELDALATDGYVRHAVDRLRALAAAAPEGEHAAIDALHLLHRLRHQTAADAEAAP